MRAGIAALALVVLTGCAAEVPVTSGLRDPAAPMSSQVNVTPARLAGNWVVRVAWAGAAPGQAVRVAPGRAVQTGPGRFRIGDGPEWWVMWMDGDNRTAAIGSPGGEFGWIMDRAPKGGADRIKAAKEIMQWMGYDMSRAME
jgi:apolipoprotein D and lipocalin family protein